MVETCEDKRHLSLHHDHYWSLLTLIKFMMDLPAQNPVPVKCCRVNWKPPDVTSLRTALKQSPATRLFGGHGKVWVHGWILWASLGSARGPIWRSGCGLWSASTTSRSWKSKKSTVRCCPCHWAIGPLGHWVEGEGCEDLNSGHRESFGVLMRFVSSAIPEFQIGFPAFEIRKPVHCFIVCIDILSLVPVIKGALILILSDIVCACSCQSVRNWETKTDWAF